MTAVLSRRALNRATLARQLLLERATMPALEAVGHLVGMQAQVPLNPYTGLWSRLAGFIQAELAGLLVDRKVVRIVVMRATIHLVTAEDCLLLRPLTQEVLDKELTHHRDFAPAPARFLPEYDNVLLSHDDRSRFAGEPFSADGPVHGTVLVDGFVAAVWALAGTTLTVTSPHHATEELAAEGHQLLGFLGVQDGEVRFP